MESNKETPGPVIEQQSVPEESIGSPRRCKNKLGRWAFVVALAAWVLFIISGFLPYDASLACGGASGVTAAIAFVMGLVSLRRSPRGGIYRGSCVFRCHSCYFCNRHLGCQYAKIDSVRIIPSDLFKKVESSH